MKVCRICANSDLNISPMVNLFDKRKQHLLQYIQMFTGLLLTRQIGMPEYICDTCLQDLKRAIKFRERCIDTQNELSRNCNVNSMNTDLKTEDGTGEDVISFTIERIPECTDELIDIITLDEDVNEFVEELDEEETADDHLWKTEYIINETEYDNSLPKTTVQEESSEVVQEKKKKRIRKIEGPLVCEVCGKSFNIFGNFRDHQLRHSGVKNFNCPLCTFKFYTNRELERHMRRHTGERPYPCRYCDSRFACLSNRSQHEKRHKDQRQFKCEKCDKSFMTSSCLKKHMLTHTGIRSHCCTVCNQWFLRRTHLSTHLRSKAHKQNLANEEQNKTSHNEIQDPLMMITGTI